MKPQGISYGKKTSKFYDAGLVTACTCMLGETYIYSVTQYKINYRVEKSMFSM
jgi:hypothetical protein